MTIWDARERSHGVLKSLKSSPVGAAPWPNLTDFDSQTAIRELLMQGGLSHHSRLQLSSCSQDPVHGATVGPVQMCGKRQLDLAIGPA